MDELRKRQKIISQLVEARLEPVSYTHLRAHETGRNLVCRLLLEKKKKKHKHVTKTTANRENESIIHNS